MIILKMCRSVNQIDDLQSSNKKYSWTFRLPCFSWKSFEMFFVAVVKNLQQKQGTYTVFLPQPVAVQHQQLFSDSVTVMKKLLLHWLFFSWISLFSEAIFFDKKLLTELLSCNDIASLSDTAATQDICPKQIW